jgi:hypothetical protein
MGGNPSAKPFRLFIVFPLEHYGALVPRGRIDLAEVLASMRQLAGAREIATASAGAR